MQTAFLHVTRRHESDSVELQEFIGTFHCTQSRLERGGKKSKLGAVPKKHSLVHRWSRRRDKRIAENRLQCDRFGWGWENGKRDSGA